MKKRVENGPRDHTLIEQYQNNGKADLIFLSFWKVEYFGILAQLKSKINNLII